MSGDIVDAIDRALTDYGTSMDAMRWVPDVPEPVCETCGGPVPCRAVLKAAFGPFTDLLITRSGPVAAQSDRAQRAFATAFATGDAPLGRMGVVLNESPPPDDPRTHALALRQSRNVGPDGRTPAGRKRRA